MRWDGRGDGGWGVCEMESRVRVEAGQDTTYEFYLCHAISELYS